MYSYDFKIDSDDKNVGTVYLPMNNCKDIPVIIYCHGWGGSRKLNDTVMLLRDMAIERNMAFVTFDFFGCGETGGDFNQMTYRRWKENLSSVIDWVSSQSFADKTRVGCYAFSSGSTAALRLAAEDDRVSFIVSVGTCISAHIFMNNGNPPSKLLADNLEKLMDGATVNERGIEFYRDTTANAPIYSLKNINCPVLFLQGTADNIYRQTDAIIAYNIMKDAGLNATHIEYDKGTHGLENVIKTSLEDMFLWLRRII